MPNLFITGNSSGLGRGLTEAFLARGWKIYGCSRRGCNLEGSLQEVLCDLSDFESVPGMLDVLLGDVESLDLVILNAGILGEVKEMHRTSLADIQNVFNINVWANKVIMDWLYAWGRPVDQVVMMSSGASVSGNKGWSAYGLSKATLNMLAKLYAPEFQMTHVSAIAPGLIDTPMQDYLCSEPDPEEFPALKRIREARGTAVMPKPRQAAERLIEAIHRLEEYPSGSFIDLRQILVPEEYDALLNASAPGSPR